MGTSLPLRELGTKHVFAGVYFGIHLPGTFVLIGPNHTGWGAPVPLMTEGTRGTPLGSVEIDSTLARNIQASSSCIRENSLAHLREHSLEVQLPFIQYFKEDFIIVPIQMMDTRYETCLEARAVAEEIAECGNQVHIVASSDMSHYEQAAAAGEKDFKAIQHGRYPEDHYRTVKNCSITHRVRLRAGCFHACRVENSGRIQSGRLDQVLHFKCPEWRF